MGSDRFTERAHQIREAFEALVELEAGARDKRLAQLRTEHPEIFHDVASLLRADDAAGSLLESLEPSTTEIEALTRDPYVLVGKTISHYQVTEWLGGGGMGVVYKAYDVRLDRVVALKFLPPHLRTDARAKAQFIREAKAASALDHPNIGYVHEIDETAAGQLFIAMAFYDGETLKQRIARGAVNVSEAIDLGCQIAEGLGAAHGAGIVHRDVKPANVLIKSNGRVKLIDFGIAIVIGEEHQANDTAVGTAAYISPEQAAGAVVDHRSDLWSLGVILFEMLTGVRPFTGADHHEVIAAIMRDDPVRVDKVRPDCSQELADVIARALSRDPDGRHHSAEDLRVELEACRGPSRSVRTRAVGISAGVLILIVFGLGLLALQRHADPGALSSEATIGRPATTSLAILTSGRSAEESQERMVVQAFVEELNATLRKIEGLRVLPTEAATPAVHGDHSIVDMFDLPHAEYVVLIDVSAPADDRRVNLSAQLFEAGQSDAIWSHSYDADLGNILILQQDLALAVVAEIEVRMTALDRERLIPEQEVHPEAFALYAMGIQASQNIMSLAHLKEAEQYFQRAIALDSTFARAFAALAFTTTYLGIREWAEGHSSDEGWSLDRLRQRTLDAVEEALRLNRTIPETWISIALMRQHFDLDWLAAERALQNAINFGPGNAESHWELSKLYMRMGRHEEAIAAAQLAASINPTSIRYLAGLSEAYYRGGHYKAALEIAEKVLEHDPTFATAHWLKARLHVAEGRPLEAVEVYEELLRDQDGSLGDGGAGTVGFAFLGYLGEAYVAAGMHEEARRLLQDVRDQWTPDAAILAFVMAVIHANFGEDEQAIDWLEQLTTDYPPVRSDITLMYPFETLRSNPRYLALVEQAGLSR